MARFEPSRRRGARGVRRSAALKFTAAFACFLGGTLGLGSVASARPLFDTREFAQIPAPGFPAMAYPAPNGHVYEGTYDNPRGDSAPSQVFEFDAAGALAHAWTISGQDLTQAHGVQVATSDAAGRLILLDKSPPRALLLDPRTGAQSVYATFPAGSVPNYAAWGPDGSLFVTDYAKPTIWRVPPGGGAVTAWLTDPQLDGGMFGTTGILLAGDRHTFVIGQQSEAGAQAGNPASGRLFTVALGADGRPGSALRQLWESRPFDGPDGFGIAASGHIYVALLLVNQIAELSADGSEITRFPALPATGANGGPVPFDAPSSARFLGTRLMVANQSYFTGNPAHQAILDVETGEPGLAELIPPLAGPPALSPTSPTTRRSATVKRCARGRVRIKGRCVKRTAARRGVRIRAHGSPRFTG